MATIKDFKLNPPTKKTELTKNNMMKYIKENGSLDDKKWFVELLNNNKERKINNLTKEEVDSYDLSKVREQFAIRFFPEISSKQKKKSKEDNKKPSFKDDLKALIDEIG